MRGEHIFMTVRHYTLWIYLVPRRARRATLSNTARPLHPYTLTPHLYIGRVLAPLAISSLHIVLSPFATPGPL